MKKILVIICGCFYINVANADAELDAYFKDVQQIAKAMGNLEYKQAAAAKNSDPRTGCVYTRQLINLGYEGLKLLNNTPATFAQLVQLYPNILSSQKTARASMITTIAVHEKTRELCKELGL